MIRKATQEDVSAIVDLSREFYATTDDAAHVPFCESTVSWLASMLADSHIMLVAELDGKVCAMIGAYIAPGMFNASVKAAHEVVWYVAPYARDSGIGGRLLREADKIRKELGCWKFEKATLSTSPPIADEILIRAGFTPSYKSFMKVD